CQYAKVHRLRCDARSARSHVAWAPLLSHPPSVRVERDEMPAADVVAVVARTSLTRGRAEVVEVSRSSRDRVLVIPRHRAHERLEPAPRGVERRAEGVE